jgi:plasmid stabilization system protein ParE
LVAFLTEKSERAAVSAARRLSAAIRSLGEFAERGRQSPYPGIRELVVPFGRAAYIIEYRVDAETVVIARIFHSLEQR